MAEIFFPSSKYTTNFMEMEWPHHTSHQASNSEFFVGRRRASVGKKERGNNELNFCFSASPPQPNHQEESGE